MDNCPSSTQISHKLLYCSFTICTILLFKNVVILLWNKIVFDVNFSKSILHIKCLVSLKNLIGFCKASICLLFHCCSISSTGKKKSIVLTISIHHFAQEYTVRLSSFSSFLYLNLKYPVFHLFKFHLTMLNQLP